MKKFTKNETKLSGSIIEYKTGKRTERFFHLYCDICGRKHPEVCVNDLCEEEGYPDGDYCHECQKLMIEQGFVGEDKSTYFFKKDYPKSNKEKLDAFLKWSKRFCKVNRLSLNGFWTYDNDYFSWEYLAKLVKDKYIVINKYLGKKSEPEKIDLGDLKTFKGAEFIKKIAAENRVQPWYYKGEGKISEKDVFKDRFKVKDPWIILDKFKQTKKILMSRSKKESFRVHADWYGIYFLILASLPGKTFHEKKFKTTELYGLRDFIEKEKPKGVVLSYITSDKECPIYDVSLFPVLNLFDIPELQYLKLLFVSKTKVKKAPTKKPWPEDAIGLGLDLKYMSIPTYDGKVEWVLAYSK